MPKLDLKKDLKALYNPSAKAISVVDVPPLTFLMLDGHGDPNTAPAYVEAVQALYALAYALKFRVKHADPAADFAVMPLEGLWWAADQSAFTAGRKDTWDWTMLILQPAAVTPALFAETLAEVREKKPDLPALARARLETYREGPAAQIKYFGAYADEGPTIANLHAFIADQGHTLTGKHHEIYLGDPRRTAPAKLATVIRQPFAA
jgi:hypothetical protein